MKIKKYEIKDERVVYEGKIKSKDMDELYSIKIDPWNLQALSAIRLKVFTEVAEYIKGSSTIIDIGCSLGYSYFDIRKINPEIKYTGIDVSQTVINQVNIDVDEPNAIFKKFNVEDDSTEEKYDFGLLQDVMLFFDDWKNTAINCLNSIKINGLLLVSDSMVRYNYRDFYKTLENVKLEHEWVIRDTINNVNIKCRLYRRLQ